MNFHLVQRIGTGTVDDPYRPDLPDGTSFVGVERNAMYLVGVEDVLPAPGPDSREGPFPRMNKRIQQAVTQRGRTIDELNVWRVGARAGR